MGRQEFWREAWILILLRDLGKFLKPLSLGGSSDKRKAHLCSQALSRGSPVEHLPPPDIVLSTFPRYFRESSRYCREEASVFNLLPRVGKSKIQRGEVIRPGPHSK